MKMLKWHQLAAQAAMVGAVLVSFSAAAAGNVPLFKDAPKADGDGSFCMSKEDGVYEHPDCRVYYSCKHNVATEHKCPDGQVFDADKNPDDDPGKSYCAAPASVAHVDCSSLAFVK